MLEIHFRGRLKRLFGIDVHNNGRGFCLLAWNITERQFPEQPPAAAPHNCAHKVRTFDDVEVCFRVGLKQFPFFFLIKFNDDFFDDTSFSEVNLLNTATTRGKKFYVGVALVFEENRSNFNCIAFFYQQSRFYKRYPFRQ